jgi:class 3 adenylate cyclase/tetratricopeptide (TPR) repeat protein
MQSASRAEKARQYDVRVNCRACGAPLGPGARFCASCGTPVVVGCSNCGAELPDGARFCPACGTPLAAGAGANATREAATSDQLVRERKVATILFADLVGFTSLGESHDPELVGSLVARVFDRLSEEVDRYEGTVEKFAGDAMLAVFGVPSIHEDDAERAVRAALEMQAAMVQLEASSTGVPGGLAIRIGVETGEVLANISRAASERDLFVTGDAVNTAARLQQAAAPGSVVVGPAAYAATREVIDYEELPAAILKGKALPTAAWRALAVKARRGGRRAPLGIEAPIIGRDEELGLLKDTLRRTVAESRPHLVTVLGAAGVGKSRLTWELEKYLDGLPETYHWRKGRCLAYAQASYSALADVVKADARIMDDHAPSTAVEALDERLAELGARDAGDIAEALRGVLALGPVPTWPREDLFDAWRRYLQSIGRLAPLVLVVEDIHWADEGLLDLLEYLGRWAEGPLLILCLARHELLERRPSWAGGIPNATTIVLAPLDASESSRLVDGLLGAGVPAALRDRIVEFAGGNPLFTEELVRMFVDRGVVRYADGRWELAAPIEEVEVPTSVQAVLAARLDGLPAPEKRLAQHASVVGRIFWDAVLAHVSRQGGPATRELLRRLRVKELVVPREPSTFAGAAEFGFRHVLIRDVAYESLPKRERAALHRQVAEWAEATVAERREELTELLAAHYLAALRYEEEFAAPGDDLRELREATYRHARAAGLRATNLYQIDLASGWLRVATDQARRLGLPVRERAALAEEFFEGSSGSIAFEEVHIVLDEALGLMAASSDRTADDEQLDGRLRAADAFHLFNLTRIDEARRLLRSGIAALEGGPPTHARAWQLSRLGWTYWRGGPVPEAVPLLERALAEAREIGDRRVEAWTLHELAVTMSMTGNPGEAVERILESFQLARALKDGQLLSRCYNNVPATMWTNGATIDEVRPIFLEAIERDRRIGDVGSLAWAAQSYADSLWEMGFIDEALPLFEQAKTAAARVGDDIKVAIQDLTFAWIDFQRGDMAGDAVDRFTEANARLGQTDEPQAEIFQHLWHAETTWARDPQGALADLRRAVEEARADGTNLYGGRMLARLALRLRDDASRRLAAASQIGVSRTGTGPLRQLDIRWMTAIQRDDRQAADDLAAVAADFEAAKAIVPAADAYADAALVGARLGLPQADAWTEAARSLYLRCGVRPTLDDLPETRWIEPAASPIAAAD